MQDRVYSNSVESTPEKTDKSRVPANVPEDAAFSALYEARTVSYSPQISRALRYSEASSHLIRHHLQAATIFFSNLLYWTPKSSAGGWVYKSVEEVREETDLGKKAQEHGRELLRQAGVIEEHRKQRRMYFRVCWGGLKPLLRLVEEASTARKTEFEASSESPTVGLGEKVRPPDSSESPTVELKESPTAGLPSVCHTDSDEQTEQTIHRSILDSGDTDAREGDPERGTGRSPAPDGLIDGEGEEQTSGETTEPTPEGTTYSENRDTSTLDSSRSPSEATPTEDGEAEGTADNGGVRRVAGRPARTSSLEPEPRWDRLEWQIRREMAGISWESIEDEDQDLAEALAEALDREQVDAQVMRVAEYAVRKDIPELTGEVVGRNREPVQNPVRYFAKSLAPEIKAEEACPRRPRAGSPAQRFAAARAATLSRGNGAADDGGAEERVSISGRKANPVHGVRRREAQRPASSYFTHGGSRRETSRDESSADK